MSDNGKDLQGSSPAPIVSAIRVGLKADGGIHIELMGRAVPDLVAAGMLAKAQDVLLHRKQSSIVVPELATNGMDLRA